MTEAAGAGATGAQAAASRPAASPASREADSRRATLLFTAASLLLALAVLLGLRLGVGVEIDAPTLALAAACVVMVWALRALWGIVVALSQPAVETILSEADVLGPVGASVRADFGELREEKRRVLRAIKELEFDHAMGKLSAEDFKQIGDRYRLRAIEVIRELEPLDGDAELHPLLAEHLSAVGIRAGLETAATTEVSA
jgi:hypothetical protein